MDEEIVQIYHDLEDGEVSSSSDEIYKPLTRPILTKNAVTTTDVGSLSIPMDEHVGESLCPNDCNSDDFPTSSSDESSDSCLKQVRLAEKNSKACVSSKKRRLRTVMLRVNTEDQNSDKKAKLSKYDLWATALQEEALMENMRRVDVTRNNNRDRDVESYDTSLFHKLNGENSLKRHVLYSSNDYINHEQQPQSKRLRSCSRSGKFFHCKQSSHNRYSKRCEGISRRHSSNRSSSESNSTESRLVEDLNDVINRPLIDIAREMAEKLHEKKDELLVRVIELVGLDIALEIFKETQRFEAEGGMKVLNGVRRRTPGGVFLFLVKHHDRISEDDKRAILKCKRRKATKKQKVLLNKMRDRRVEELKTLLYDKEAELSTMQTRKDCMLFNEEMKKKHQCGYLSNPPPSPEANEPFLMNDPNTTIKDYKLHNDFRDLTRCDMDLH